MDGEWLADRFEADRTRLQAVAYRLLGSPAQADDAVQEAWLRLARTDASSIDNLGGWLTTVVARVSLDMLRSRRTRREEPLAAHAPETIPAQTGRNDPEHEAELADSVGLALLVVLETLAPAERLAFVLHDLFDVPFDEIAPIVGRSPVAARQLASRARRRVRGASADAGAPAASARDRARQRLIVHAFLAASRSGDFQALLAVLDPGVTMRADAAALEMSSRSGWLRPPEIRGAPSVAEQFSGRAQAAEPALIDGVPGVVWAPGGTPRAAFVLTFASGRIAAIDLIADPVRLAELAITTQ